MDALAYFRREKELPALSINWGNWAEIGLAARFTERHRIGGFLALKPEEGIKAFELALRQERPQITIAKVDWKLVTSQDVILSELIGSKSFKGPTLLQRLTDAMPSERKELLNNYLQRILVKILGISALKPDLGFFEAGIDSLMVKIYEKIQSDIGNLYKLPPTLGLDYPNINKLSEYY